LRLFNAYLEGTRKPVTSLRSLIGRNRRGAAADAAKPRSPRTQRGR